MNFYICLGLCLLYVDFVATSRCFKDNANIPSKRFAMKLDAFEEYVVGQNMSERYRAEPIALPKEDLPDYYVYNSNIRHTKLSRELYTQEITYNIPSPVLPGLFCIRKEAQLVQDSKHCDNAIFSAIFKGQVRTMTAYWSSDPTRYILMFACVGAKSNKIRKCPLARTVVSVLLPESNADAPLDDALLASVAKDLIKATCIEFESKSFKWYDIPFGETQTAAMYYSERREGVFDYMEYDNILVDDSTSLVFKTKGFNDASLILQEDCDEYHTNTAQVIIGGWGNTKSVIREVPEQNPVDAEFAEQILSPGEYRHFWMSWTDGVIKVGKGNIVGTNSVMSWDGLSDDVN